MPELHPNCTRTAYPVQRYPYAVRTGVYIYLAVYPSPDCMGTSRPDLWEKKINTTFTPNHSKTNHEPNTTQPPPQTKHPRTHQSPRPPSHNPNQPRENLRHHLRPNRPVVRRIQKPHQTIPLPIKPRTRRLHHQKPTTIRSGMVPILKHP